MDAEQNREAAQLPPQEQKNLFRKKWPVLLLILFCLVLIPGTVGGILFLGEAQDHPVPTIGVRHFSVMNSLLRKYRRQMRRRKKKQIPSSEKLVFRFDHKEVNFLLDLGRCFAKPVENFSWKAHFRKDGSAAIEFSRHLTKKIGLNGEVHIKPSFKDDRLRLKVTYFRLGRCVLDPGLLQKRLDQKLEEMREKQEYKRFLGQVHSLDYQAGSLILVLKGDSFPKIPLPGR